MFNNQDLIDKLRKMLAWKKSKKYYASELGISEDAIEALMRIIRLEGTTQREQDLIEEQVNHIEETIIKFEEDLKSGKAESIFRSPQEIRSLQELIEKGKIDISVWNIDKYVQNFWGNIKDPHWQVKAYLSKKTKQEHFQKNFIEFLSNYKEKAAKVEVVESEGPSAMLVINKQDEHLNKFDILGNNDIKERFMKSMQKTKVILSQAAISNTLDKVVYIIGSDQFNSEWTNLTTKGTPQQNIMGYHEAFTKICNYEVQMIQLLRSYCPNVSVIYVPGNHDEYVGWHLVNWLKCFFNGLGVEFDDTSSYRKYITFGKSAVMFNHGDAIKPAKLASIFPVEYKQNWSSCSNYYIFTGDKHHEVSIDFNGIMFYQLTALSTAKSLWDDKQGHVGSRNEITGFVIDAEKGITSILKQPL